MADGLAYGNFASHLHCWLAGIALGTLRKHGADVYPGIDEDGNYTDIIELRVDEDIIRLKVLPPERLSATAAGNE